MPPHIRWEYFIFAMLVAGVRADSLDDFTNNLFTDLGPVLALFGERVTMQFMSQAMGWEDCIALAMAPLGIITILISAIRVGGPMWLKAVIGRAKENTAAAEMELMSSTSAEVCELFNGESIIRCQGTAPVWEYICILPKSRKNLETRPKLRYMSLEKALEDKILTKPEGRAGFLYPLLLRFVEWFILHADASAMNWFKRIFAPCFRQDLIHSGKGPLDSRAERGENSSSSANPQEPSAAFIAEESRNRSSSTNPLEPSAAGIEEERTNSPSSANTQELSAAGTKEGGGNTLSSIYPQALSTIPATECVQSETDQEYITIIRDTSSDAPNISLHLQKSHERGWIRAIAILGTVLQTGVIFFLGVMTYHPKVKHDFQKNDKLAAPYSFPLAASGTVLLVFGLFLCAHVVEKSTDETRYEAVSDTEFRVYWLQQDQTVSDQVFKSYAISPSKTCTIITKSKRGKAFQGNDLDARVNRFLHQAITIIGVVIGLLGFVFQFIGLRAMNSAASLAQLGAVGIMTLCRALARPGFATSFKPSKLLQGFELDWLAWELLTLDSTGNSKPGNQRGDDKPGGTTKQMAKHIAPGFWTVITGDQVQRKPSKLSKSSTSNSSVNRLVLEAQKILEARRELARLAEFQGTTSLEAINLAQAIEKALGILFSKDTRNDYFRWYINVSHSPSTSAATTEDNSTNIWLDLCRQDKAWKVGAHDLDAVLSLWIYGVRAQEKDLENEDKKPNTGDEWLRRTIGSPGLRLLGPEEFNMQKQLSQDLKSWTPQHIQYLSQVTANDISQNHKIRVVGFNPSLLANSAENNSNTPLIRNSETYHYDPEDQASDLDIAKDNNILAIETREPIENLYAKHLLYSFMCSVAKTPGASIKPETELRTNTARDRGNQPFKFLWNRQLESLADTFRSLGFGSNQEALIGIISPLSMAEILPYPHAWFDSVCADVTEACAAGNWINAVRIYQSFCDKAKDYSLGKTGIWECALVCLLMALNDVESQFSSLDNPDGFFFQPLKSAREGLQVIVKSLRLPPDLRNELDRLSMTSGLPLSLDLRNFANDNLKQFPEYFNVTETHLEAIKSGRLLTDSEERKSEQNKRDICGRVPLHYAAMNARDCLEEEFDHFDEGKNNLFDVNAKDCNGYTPLHYACWCGNVSSMQYLLRLDAKFDVQGADGMYPMHLAARQGQADIFEKFIRRIRFNQSAALEHKMNIVRRLRDYNGLIPVQWAVIKGHQEVIQLLEDDVDATDNRGWTSLHLAVSYYEETIFDKLCQSSGDKNKRDNEGDTPLLFACKIKKWEAVKQLLRCGADVNIHDTDGLSVLERAVEGGARLDLIEALLAKNPHPRDIKIAYRYLEGVVKYDLSPGPKIREALKKALTSID